MFRHETVHVEVNDDVIAAGDRTTFASRTTDSTAVGSSPNQSPPPTAWVR